MKAKNKAINALFSKGKGYGRTIALSLLTSLITTAGIAGSALAEPRPVELGESWDDQGSLSSICEELNAESCALQDLFDAMTVSGDGIDAVKDQTNFDYFTNTATGGSLGSFMFEVAGFAGQNQFGIYQLENPLKRATLFDGINDWGDRVTVDFLVNGDLSVSTKGLTPDYQGPTLDQTYEDFGNVFGFYITTAKGETFYSDDSLNPGGLAQALIYQGDNNTVLQLPGKAAGTFVDDEFIIAFEDLSRTGNTDNDFNDLVVMMESIEPDPIPEPSTLLSLGLMTLVWGAIRRKQS